MFRGNANIVTFLVWVATAVAVAACAGLGVPRLALAVAIAGVIVAMSPRKVDQWQRGVLLRLGRFRRVLAPGISWVIPGIDIVEPLVDMRIRSTAFTAEKTLTRDTVPVDVDAVLFWVVTDAQRAVLEVENFQLTVSWAAQTTLRDVIGRAELTDMISDREAIDRTLQEVIDHKTTDWGVTVQSVEIRDVRIPPELEDAMSRKAQADREREARVILAHSELQVAAEMEQAAKVYVANPTALQLRAMNMTYESIKERGALMVIPSSLGESMDPSRVLGLAAASHHLAPES